MDLSRHHRYNRIGQLDHIEHLRLHPPAQPWQPPQRQAHRSQRYAYDAQYRLTSEAVHSHQDDGRTIGQREQLWHYDNAGNRIHPDDTRYRPLERAAPGNRLHRSAHARYRHDAWGNVVQIDHTAGQLKGQQVRLAYDGEHRLLASERIQTGTDGQRHSVLTRYHYDPMSRRVGKQHLQRVSQGDGQKTEWRIQSSLWFGWDGDRMVTMQNDRQASTTIYEPGSFVPMLRVDKQLQADERRAKGETRTYHVHCNHLGTPEALIAQDGLELVWQIELDPWGQTQREYNPNNILQPIRMQGQQLDAETGLLYNRYRYYDPAGGRYVTQDPIGLLGGWNTYTYADGSPTTKTDPLGLETYICTRPLGGLPGSYAPPLLNHTYVCVGSGANMTCGSTTASSGGALSNIFGSSPGKPTTSATDFYKPEACDLRQGGDSCIETCIANELKKPTRPKYGVGASGIDCQEYTEDVVSACEKRCVRR
jgi:RHS repeat-associated protein